ncbi:iron chelate uptake ABC transporter family permease subunit [Dermabacteraceae bacterium P13147]
MSTSRITLAYLAAALALVAVAAASLLIGARPIPAAEVWQALVHGGDSANSIVVHSSRVPRTLAGIVVGAAFGVAGALIQAFTRNPLADPGILGVNAGASFAVVLGVLLFNAVTPLGYIWFALAGAVLATVAVYAIGGGVRRKADPVTITLAGVALGALLTGISSGITLTHKEVFDKMRFWGAGSLVNRGFDAIAVGAPLVLLGIVIAVVIGKKLDALALGDEMASSLGTNLSRTRSAAIVAVTLLAGAGTAIAGPIGFIGLMVPHFARALVGANNMRIMTLTVLAAPVLLLFSDILGRVASTGELQVGIVTAFLGAPVLIVLARRPRLAGL